MNDGRLILLVLIPLFACKANHRASMSEIRTEPHDQIQDASIFCGHESPIAFFHSLLHGIYLIPGSQEVFLLVANAQEDNLSSDNLQPGSLAEAWDKEKDLSTTITLEDSESNLTFAWQQQPLTLTLTATTTADETPSTEQETAQDTDPSEPADDGAAEPAAEPASGGEENTPAGDEENAANGDQVFSTSLSCKSITEANHPLSSSTKNGDDDETTETGGSFESNLPMLTCDFTTPQAFPNSSWKIVTFNVFQVENNAIGLQIQGEKTDDLERKDWCLPYADAGDKSCILPLPTGETSNEEQLSSGTVIGLNIDNEKLNVEYNKDTAKAHLPNFVVSCDLPKPEATGTEVVPESSP